MNNLSFVKFGQEHYDLYTRWSEDAEINRWLGDATQEWLDYVIETSQSFTWMVFENEVAVANLQVDLLEGDPSQAQVTIMVAPHLRHKGYRRRVLTALLYRVEVAGVQRFYAFVRPANSVSIGLLHAMGYKLVSEQPDEHGYVEYELVR